MNDSPWFVKHKNILRGMILLLLIISLVGPWAFDKINVPAKYTCSAPNVRLYGDFCGLPMSGIQIFGWFFGGIFYIFLEIIRGTFAGRSRELIIVIYILPLIPFFTILLSIWKKETRQLRKINLVAWILAFLSTLTLFILQINHQAIRLWGLWLYIVVTVSMIIIEISIMKKTENL